MFGIHPATAVGTDLLYASAPRPWAGVHGASQLSVSGRQSIGRRKHSMTAYLLFLSYLGTGTTIRW
jgi:hypothetical protein